MRRAEFNPVEGESPWERVVHAGIAMTLVLLAGTGAYRLLGLGWLDAFYQTLITVTTVGYLEVGDEITPVYRAVTSVLILLGVGITVFSIGQVFGALMEGRLTDHVGRSRMGKQIDNLSGHVIVAGWGQVGHAIAESLTAANESVVVVDRRRDVLDEVGRLAVIGDATDDEVLKRAGIERARSLVTALSGDADNLFVTLSGRAINPSLFIVARVVGPSSGPKLEQAGADRVVDPHKIGADRMSSFVVQPNVADFLGETMTDHQFEVRLGEVVVRPGSRLLGRSLADSGFLAATGLTLLAVRGLDGSFVHRRDAGCVPEEGQILIVLGTADQHEASRVWLRDNQGRP